MIGFAKGALTVLVWCGLLACAALVVLGFVSTPASYRPIDQQIATAARWEAWTLAAASFGGAAGAAGLLALIEISERILDTLRRPLAVVAPLSPIPPPTADAGSGHYARSAHPAEQFASGGGTYGFSEQEIRAEIALIESEGQRYRYATPARLREVALTRLVERRTMEESTPPSRQSWDQVKRGHD